MTVDRVGLVSFYVRGDGSEDEGEHIETSTRVVEGLIELLEDEGVDYVVNDEVAETLGCDGVPLDGFDYTDLDLVVTVGGDGTVLRTFAAMDGTVGVPVLGVNTGRVGFLADVPPESAVDEVERVLDGFETERRSRLAVEVNGERVATALNECVVVASRPAKILEFDVHHGGELVESVRSDGMVVATPTGSTAYSMSAGGPLVDPTVDAFVVVPLAPFRRRISPWVLGADDETVVVPRRVEKEANVMADGERVAEVGKGDEVRFTRADQDALFVRTYTSFFERVREKLKLDS